MNSFLPLFFLPGRYTLSVLLFFLQRVLQFSAFSESISFLNYFYIFCGLCRVPFFVHVCGAFFNFPGQKSKSEKIIRFFCFLYCQHLRHIDLFHRLRRGKSCLYHSLTARHIRFYGIKQCFRDLRIAGSQRYHRRRK